MALTLTELQAVTDYYVESGTNDIYFQGNILLYKLLGGENVGTNLVPGGKKIQVILEYAKSNGGTFGATTKLALDKKEIFNAAFFRWAGHYAGITIDLDDERQNTGDLAIINLVNGKLKNGQKTIRNNMGTDIYSAAATATDINGLGDLFSTTTSTAYGEIAEDDMADWKANVITAAAPVSFKAMQAIRRTASIDDNSEGKPNLYITTQLLKDGFERTLQSQARYSDVRLINAGFDNILFGGAPVVADNKQTAGYMDALNLRYLDIKTHRDYNFTKPVWASPIDQPDTKVCFIKWSGNLVCKNRKAHCRQTGMTEPA